ncbi:MAG: hypothetical protein QW568_00070 [Candidatus Anstonellaceae archaeon]
MRILLSLLLLLSALPLAFSSVSSYTIANWLSVSMDVQYLQVAGCAGSVTGACGSTGAILPSSGPSGTTTVTLSLKNTGPADRKGVEISQDLSFVPQGSKISYEPAPSSSQGQVVWKLGSMKKGGSAKLSYSFNAKIAAESQIPQISAKSLPPQATITAPQLAKPGEKLEIYAKSPSGSPLAEVGITITFPDGTSKKATTDSNGKTSIVASKEGFYTYSIDGYALSRLSSTEVKKPQEAVPVAAASAAGLPAKVVSFLSSLAPLLAAIFVTAVVVFILYGFITQKKEPGHAPLQEEPSSFPASSNATSQQTQQLPHSPLIQPTFSTSRESALPLDTRRLVELRKNQMWQSEKTYQNHSYSQEQHTEKTVQHEEKQHTALAHPPAEKTELHTVLPNLVYREGKQAQPTEKTSLHMESEPHAIALQSLSSQDVESTLDESELEKTVRQLEEIRQKLQERKAQMEAMESVHSAYVNKLSEERKAAKAASSPTQKKPAKPASHPIQKKSSKPLQKKHAFSKKKKSSR